MITIFLKLSDDCVKDTLKKLFRDFSVSVVNDASVADFILSDDSDKFVLNNIHYFYKPLNFFSLIDVIKSSSFYYIGNAKFFSNRKCIINGDDKITLTNIENAILLQLLKAKDKGVSALSLVEVIFKKNTESNLKSLSTHIYNLKKKLEVVVGKNKNIVSVNSMYKLDF